MKDDTAGDPSSGLRWTRRTPYSIASALQAGGTRISDRTIGRLLKDQGCTLRVNHKKLAGAAHPDRAQQFDLIAALRARAMLPLISVDTKKKEHIGRFRNAGTRWSRTPEGVHTHDFRS